MAVISRAWRPLLRDSVASVAYCKWQRPACAPTTNRRIGIRVLASFEYDRPVCHGQLSVDKHPLHLPMDLGKNACSGQSAGYTE